MAVKKETDQRMPIAIVGLAGTFPGDASNPQKLWSVLMNKQSTRTEVPPDRFNIDAFYHPSGDRNGTTHTRWAHFMNRNLAAFDAPFFSILPIEAQAMDVQSRMALECAYEALENAGIPMENVRGTRTGCYVACFTHDYAELTARDDDSQPKYAFTGLGSAMMSNRISWFLDIKGPSVTIDTACSSSLVALHMACQSIYSGEVDMMLVGGANVILLPRTMANQSSLGFLSEDGRSKAFDQRADGYARGEGVSFLVLKPLSAALRDGDAIRAVIRGTGVNQDGRTPGITVPSGESQEQLIRTVYERAGLDPSNTPFVEAHGTGTQKGDAVEARVLAKTFGHCRSSQNPVYIGSVKTNIGHLEAAAGVAQVIKTILALENAMIPPNIWFKQANPNIPLDEWHLKIPIESLKWPAGEKRRASINSFGYGGTNAHCILEAAEEFIPSMKVAKTIPHNSLTAFSGVQNTPIDVLPKLLLWSSHDKMGISRMALQYAEYLDSHVKSGANNVNLVSLLCQTLHSRRSSLPWKSYIISRTVDEMVSCFQNQVAHPLRSSKSPSLAFVFTGQGAQWPGMGCQLLCYPTFANSLRQADSFLKSTGMNGSLIDELMAAPGSSSLHLPVVSQTLCTVLQVALVELLYDFGIRPAIVVGHSGGEIAAAYAKGAISKEDAWTIAFHRGRLCSAIIDIAPSVKGGMLVAGLSKMDCTRYIERLTKGIAVVACVNSPVSCTLAGDLSALEQLEDMLQSAGHFHRRLRVDRAYHSPHMQLIAEHCLNSISRVHPLADTGHGPTITMYSTVTGRAVQSKDLTPSYWISNMVEPVEFVDAVNALLIDVENSSNQTVMVEIGPHSALKGPLRQILDARGVPPEFLYTSLLIRDKDAHHTVLESIGFLAQQGYPVDMHRVNQLPPNGEFLVDVPSYSWNHSEHNNYWAESPISRKSRFRPCPRNDLCGIKGEDELPGEPTWRHILSPRENPWILDHRVQGSILYPAAGILTAVLEAVRQYVDKDTISYIELQDVHITRPIIFSAPDNEIRTRLRLRSIAGGGDIYEFRHFFQKANDEWELNCTGTVHFGTLSLDRDSSLGFPDDTEKVNSTFRSLYNECCLKCFIEPEPDRLYSRLSSVGLEFGPWFQNLVHIAKGRSLANATVEIPRTSDCMPSGFEQDMLIHPVVLDGLVQLGLNTSREAHEEPGVTMVPVAFKRVRISTATQRAPGTRIVGYSTLRDSAIGVKVDVVASDDRWKEPWILLEGLEFAMLSGTPSSVSISEASVPRKLASRLEWKLDIKYTPKAIIHKSCEDSVTDLTVEEERPQLESLLHDLQRGALICIQRVLQACPLSDVAPSPSHLRTLHQAMTRIYRENSSMGTLISSNQQAHDQVLQRVADYSIDGEIMHHHCQYLDQVLRGKIHSLQVLLEDGRLNRWYAEGITWRANHAKISAYLRLYAHKHPKANILEIGGGTGGLTLSALQAMTMPDGSALFDSYCFTDISGAFFEKAQQKFKHWVHSMKFTVLDIEKDIHEQGFEDGKFDLILADNVLHATKSIYQTLSSVKKLLKPNGQLVLSEITRNTPHITLTVGALEGWWLGVNDGRPWEPTLSVERWDKALREAGFTGVDICLKDREGEHHIMSGMIATAKEDEREIKRIRIEPAFVLIHPETPTAAVSAFLEAMTAHLQQFSREAVTTESLARVARLDLSGKSCLLLLDADCDQSGMNLADINQTEWDSLKNILVTCADATWITSGATGADGNPWASMALGLVRSFRAENPSSAVTIIDLASKTNFLDPSTISIVAKLVIAGGRSQLNAGEPHDWEYCIRDSEVLIPRAIPDDAINDAVFNCSTNPQMEKIRFSQPNKSLALANFQTMCFVDDPVYRSQPLKSDEVEIQVQTTWVQDAQNSLLSIGGEKRDVGLMGTVCGTVFRLGSAANAAWSVGDRIMTFHRGAIRNFFRVPLGLCQKIPEQLGSFRDAAKFPFIYSMAYYCLVHQASLKSGEAILIHCQRDGFDEAVISLALQAGATVFLTVSSQSRKEQLAKRYSLSQASIFNYKDTRYNLESIWAATMNRGVDVVLNHIPNGLYPEASQYLAPGGRLVQLYSHREGDTSLAFTWPATSKSICVYLVSDQALAHEEPETVAQIFTRVTQLCQSGAIQGLGIESSGPECRSDDCLHVTRTGDDTAADEMTLETNPNAQVPVLIQRPIAHLLSDATYIIAGGSGGLGIALARWMLQRGAKHIALLSRSPRSKPGVTRLEKEMNINGAHLTIIACDITDEQEVHAAIAQIGSSHPPVKGIIQAAMVLADSVYQNMTLESWNRAVRPKVHGSWNLHKYTPHEVDFFILLSSFVGVVGLRGQANYAAGNSFQDALASYRQSRGQTAVSLDVGFVDGAGFISNSTRRVGDNISKFSPVHIRQDEFLRMVEYAVINSDSLPAQVITGCGTGGMVMSHQAEADISDIYWFTDPRFKALAQVDLQHTERVRGQSSQTSFSLRTLLATAVTVDEAAKVMLGALCRKLATSSSIAIEEIDPSRPLNSYGVDSLLAVDLRAYFASEAQSDISVFELTRDVPMTELARDLAGRSKHISRDI